MKSVLKFEVLKDFSGAKLLEVLKYQHGLSFSLIKKAKRIENGILVNGKLTYTNEKVFENDKVEVIIETEDEKSENIPLCNLPVNIVFEDDYLLVIDKDGGVPTHPSLNNYEKSVAGAVMYYYSEKGINFVFRPVNRLDKGTSGLMVIAKNPYIHELLKKSMHTGSFSREYLALVCGQVKEDGVVNAPIFREDNSIIKRIVDKRGASAVTHYNVVKSYDDKTLLKLKLETGRTHQIRVHMNYIGHPVYGDFLYGTEAKEINRPALHSYKISLVHPVTKENISLKACLKNDIKKIIQLKK